MVKSMVLSVKLLGGRLELFKLDVPDFAIQYAIPH